MKKSRKELKKMPKVQLGVRIEADLATKLEEIAKEEMRSVNNLIEVVLTRYAKTKVNAKEHSSYPQKQPPRQRG